MRLFAALVILGAAVSIGHAQAPSGGVSPQASATAGITGRVFASGPGDSVVPLGSVRVQMTPDDGSPRTVFTDSDGRFAVPSLVPGAYRLAFAKAGYVPANFGSRQFRDPGTAVQIPQAAVVNAIEMRLEKAAAISGRVLDDRGDPLIGMTVTAEMHTAGANAAGQSVVAATARLDDLGEYRLGGLPQGAFRVSVDVAPWVLGPNGMPYTGDGKPLMLTVRGGAARIEDLGKAERRYYPGGVGLAGSETLVLASGEERRSIDFTVPAVSPQTWTTFLGQPPVNSRSGRGAIRGRVTRVDGRPLASASVRLVGESYPGIAPSTVTDVEGRYELTGLPPARFRVIAERPGFLSFEHGQERASDPGASIVLGLDDSRDRLDIALPQPGAVAGSVVDERGDPVEGATVHVLQSRYESGRPRLDDAGGLGTHTTDDLGRYRIHGLRPGQYIVSATVGQAGLPGYAPTYFPSTSNPGGAQWVEVGLSAQVTGLDFTLAPVPTARVSGTRVNEAGAPAGGTITLTPSHRSGSVAPIPTGARTYPDGRFEFTNVAPGEYVLQAFTPGNSQWTEGEFASTFVSVDGTDVTGIIVRTSSGSSIRGRVTFEGPREAWLWSELSVSAVPVDVDRSPRSANPPARGPVREDWTFEMTGISGPRLLRVNAPSVWALLAVRLNGIDVTDNALPFGTKDQSLEDLEVVLTDRVSELSGTVTDARGRRMANHPVIVFSSDRALWGPASRFVTMVRTESDGAYVIRRLPPGEYHVAAIDRLIDGEWQDEALLDFLLPLAPKVTLAEGQTNSVSARVIVR